jgi:hypothetical protein
MKKFHLKGEKEGERTRCRQTNYGGKKVAMLRIKLLDEFLILPGELQCKKCLETHKSEACMKVF